MENYQVGHQEIEQLFLQLQQNATTSLKEIRQADATTSKVFSATIRSIQAEAATTRNLSSLSSAQRKIVKSWQADFKQNIRPEVKEWKVQAAVLDASAKTTLQSGEKLQKKIKNLEKTPFFDRFRGEKAQLTNANARLEQAQAKATELSTLKDQQVTLHKDVSAKGQELTAKIKTAWTSCQAQVNIYGAINGHLKNTNRSLQTVQKSLSNYSSAVQAKVLPQHTKLQLIQERLAVLQKSWGGKIEGIDNEKMRNEVALEVADLGRQQQTAMQEITAQLQASPQLTFSERISNTFSKAFAAAPTPDPKYLKRKGELFKILDEITTPKKDIAGISGNSSSKLKLLLKSATDFFESQEIRNQDVREVLYTLLARSEIDPKNATPKAQLKALLNEINQSPDLVKAIFNDPSLKARVVHASLYDKGEIPLEEMQKKSLSDQFSAIRYDVRFWPNSASLEQNLEQTVKDLQTKLQSSTAVSALDKTDLPKPLNNILQEIVQTETTFVRNMNDLKNLAVVLKKKYPDDPKMQALTDQILTAFSNPSQIAYLLSQIENRSGKDVLKGIIRAFSSPQMRVAYQEIAKLKELYENGLPNEMQKLLESELGGATQQLKEQNVKTFLKKTMKCQDDNIPTLMIQPIQRIVRYALLLAEVSKTAKAQTLPAEVVDDVNSCLSIVQYNNLLINDGK